MKYSKLDGVVAWSGGNTVLRTGQSIDDDHPLVAERPELFGSGDEKASTPHPNKVHQQTRTETTMQPPGTNRVARSPRTASGQ